MDEFDLRMKTRAKTEDCPMPEGFDGRLGTALENLPERGRYRPHRLRRGMLIAAAIAALCIGGAIAAPTMLTMAEHIIDEQGVPSGFRELAGKLDYQPYSSAAGVSVTDQGYTLTVDSIGVDDTFITLYYTITGEEKIPVNEDGAPQLWSLRLKADGDYLKFWGTDQETELVDAYTLRVIQRSPVLKILPDVVNLEIYADELFYDVSGTWHLALAVDKSAPAAESLVVEPNVKFNLNGSEVTVKKVSVSPSGGGLVLSQVGGRPQAGNFVLRDDKGNALPQKVYGRVSSPISPISNFIAFSGGSADMEFITLIPYAGGDTSHRVYGKLDNFPLTDECADNGYTMLSLEVGPDKAVGVFRVAGIMGESDNFTPDFTLLDADGETAALGDAVYTRERDGDTGLWTVTISYPDATAEQVAGVAGVTFWQPDGYKLEDQAVTIPLK